MAEDNMDDPKLNLHSEDEAEDDDDDEEEEETIESFESMDLDQRLLHAIAKQGWRKPTLIQAKAIPLALEGYDILARARTGTGKTGAFTIPILQKILMAKKFATSTTTTTTTASKIRALILAPSKELCNQILQNFSKLIEFCRRDINIMDISHGNLDDKRNFLITEQPDILISTPKKIIEYFQAKILKNLPKQLDFLVIDESDLMFSFGYREDLLKIFEHLSSSKSSNVQHFLMSATLNTDVRELKNLLLNNPVILKLEEPDLPESDKLQQYHIEVFDDEEKFVLINALLKLGLIVGKTIIFVANIDRCYRLRLFLEQFGIRSCLLNSELPIKSRCSIIEQFNNDNYDIIIASDEKCLTDPNQRKTTTTKTIKRKKLAKTIMGESSVARGIDFKFVSNVINFDFPETIDSYIHRVGRTARGGGGNTDASNDDSCGTVLSFVGPDEHENFQRVCRKFQRRQSSSNETTNVFRPYQFRMNELEAFRYRSRDALRSITTIAIREARLREIRREMLQSKQLQNEFFQKHPKDLKILRFDRPLDVIKSAHGNRSHLKDLPDYIIPKTLQTSVRSKRENRRIEQQAMLNYQPSLSGRKNKRKSMNQMKTKLKNQQNDPLKTFRMNAIQRYKNKKRQKSRK